MLDDLPVHVYDVEAPIRTILEMHRAEPRVSRSQKLNTLLVGRTTRHPAHPVGLQHLPVDQVAPSIADENVVDEVRAIGITAVHRRPSGPREITRDPPTALDHAWDYPTNSPPRPNNPPRLVGTNPEHLSRGSVGSDAHPRRRQSDPGIARSMRPVQGHPLEMITVAAHESISHRIERESVLTAARLRTERFGQRIEAEIQTPQIETGSLRTRPDHTISPIGTGGPVKAVIQPPIEGIEESLNIESGHPTAESAHHDAAFIGPTIARRVFEPQDIRRGPNIQPAPRTNESRRPRKVVSKDRRTVEATIPIEILQHPNPPGMRGLIPALGVIDHFGDERAAILIKSHRHRTHHLRLACRQFQTEPLPNLERLQSSIRRYGSEASQVSCSHIRRPIGFSVGLRIAHPGLG